MDMSTTMQRVASLVEQKPGHGVAIVASILRALEADKTDAYRAHRVNGILRKLSAAQQNAILAAVEHVYAVSMTAAEPTIE